MLGSFLSWALTLVLGYLYPAYACYKMLKLNGPQIHQELRFWCQYWILSAMMIVFDRVGGSFFSWFPMYSEAKLAFMVYLWHPRTRGTSYIYETFFRPYVAKHEPEIDRSLTELRTRAGGMIVQCLKSILSWGQTRLFEILQYFSSQSASQLSAVHPTQALDNNDDDGGQFNWETDDDEGDLSHDVASIPLKEVTEAGPSNTNRLSHFVAMGFSAKLVAKAIEQNRDGDTDGILDTLLTYGAVDGLPSRNGPSTLCPATSDKDSSDDISDTDDFDFEERAVEHKDPSPRKPSQRARQAASVSPQSQVPTQRTVPQQHARSLKKLIQEETAATATATATETETVSSVSLKKLIQEETAATATATATETETVSSVTANIKTSTSTTANMPGSLESTISVSATSANATPEAMQVDAVISKSIPATSQEASIEEAILLTRGRLRKRFAPSTNTQCMFFWSLFHISVGLSVNCPLRYDEIVNIGLYTRSKYSGPGFYILFADFLKKKRKKKREC